MSKATPSPNQDKKQTQSEIWSQYLQRRVMRLLLFHDQQLFRGQFRAFFVQSTLPQIPLLQFYDRYLKIQLLGDELLHDIMPRIRIQLSLQRDIIRLQEEAPTRGDIDWSRTVSRAINEFPDQPPLSFDTQLPQQNMVIPENLLIVAILLEYRQIVRDTLQTDRQEEILHAQERQNLISEEEQVERELAAPYARVLVAEAKDTDIEVLIEQVVSHIKPGPNPYADLLTWWQQFQELHIGRTLARRHLSLTNKRSTEQIDIWLYELWVALEILDTLVEKSAVEVETLDLNSDRLSFLFTWEGRRFRFNYRRLQSISMQQAFGWDHIHAATPSYTIEREHPLSIHPGGPVVWQEPPLLLSAKYSADTEEQPNIQEPLEKLLGGMQLAGSHHAIFLSPIVPEPTSSTVWSTLVKANKHTYVEPAHTQSNIYQYKLSPDMPQEELRQRLLGILHQITELLPERPAPICYGIFLDKETVNVSRQQIQRGNVLCPKPHIGQEVFDIVDDKIHCLQDPRLCHVYGQAITPPFVIRVSTLEGLAQQSNDLRTRSEQTLSQAEDTEDEARAEQLRNSIFLGIGRSIEQYVKRHGNTTAIEARFEEWIFGDYWKQHPRHLSEEARNDLLSGEYVWEEYKNTNNLQDWAAPAVQYCRALEHEIKRRIHDYYPDKHRYYQDVGQKGFDGQMTLGFLETSYIYKNKPITSTTSYQDKRKINSSQHNWPLCEVVVTHSGCNIKDFENTLNRMVTAGTSKKRNKLAHGEAVSQSDALALRDTIIGRKGKPGILLWLVEHLEPKR